MERGDRPAMLTPAKLKDERGWTDALIRQFLGEPDKLTRNPYYLSGPKMKLYLERRVAEVEALPAFMEAFEEAAARSARAKAAAGRAMEALWDAVDCAEFTVPAYALADVRASAIRSYNRRIDHRGKFDSRRATADSDPAFLDRITVNFIRHELTDYELVLRALKGRAGKAFACMLVKDRVLEKVAVTYPELAGAALDQKTYATAE